MNPGIATVVYGLLIAGLFYLDRNRRARTSAWLWLPVVWMWLACSRPLSDWLLILGWINQPWPTGSSDVYLDGSPIDRNFLIAMLVLGFFVLCKRGSQVVYILRANWAILLFFGYCALSVLWSDYPEVALKRWVKVVGNIVMVLIVVTERDQLSAIQRVLSRVTFTLIPLSILFIKYYPEFARGYNVWTWETTVNGVADNKNGLGVICLILGLGSVWRFCQALRNGSPRKSRALVAHGVLILMVGWLLWMANSITSVCCFVMASGLMIATCLHSVARRPVIVHAMLASMVTVSLYALFFDTGGGLVGSLGRDATLTGRTDLWRLVLGMAGNPLLGTGFESFWLGKRLDKLWSMIWWHPNEAHNGYLEIYLTLGWIGVALMTLMIVMGYRNALVALRRDPDTGRLMLPYFVTAVVYNITEAAFKGMDPIWFIFLWGAMAVPIGCREKARATVSISVAGNHTSSALTRDPIWSFRPL